MSFAAAMLIAMALDALIGWLGEENIWRPAPRGSHVPERAAGRAGPLEAPSWTQDLGARPLRLLDPPEPIEATAPGILD